MKVIKSFCRNKSLICNPLSIFWSDVEKFYSLLLFNSHSPIYLQKIYLSGKSLVFAVILISSFSSELKVADF
jgi:hypothetical protein